VLDWGTGSGCIALALKHKRPHWQLSALDKSAEALLVAKENAARLGLTIHWIQSDGCSSLLKQDLRVDAIVANPPYVDLKQHPALDPEVIEHEPMMALAWPQPEDPLGAYRFIFSQAAQILKPQGQLFLEHGLDQSDRIQAMAWQFGWQTLQVIQDSAGIQRHLILSRKNPFNSV
jgi:release factor glutamine methyltransferase